MIDNIFFLVGFVKYFILFTFRLVLEDFVEFIDKSTHLIYTLNF